MKYISLFDENGRIMRKFPCPEEEETDLLTKIKNDVWLFLEKIKKSELFQVLLYGGDDDIAKVPFSTEGLEQKEKVVLIKLLTRDITDLLNNMLGVNNNDPQPEGLQAGP